MRGGTTLAFAALPALALLTAAAVWLITAQQLIASSSSFAAPPPSLAPRLGVSEAHIIALDPDAPHVQGLRRLNEHWLGIPTRAMRAVNGTQALVDRPLPLYTRMLLSVGRHEHMQLGGPAMLGTLLSHMRLWNNDTNTVIMVLEEDALIDAASRERLLQLAADTAVALPDWDILMLETGHLTVAGPMRPVGQLGVTWAREEAATAAVLVPPEAACFWMGTRGYILRPSGARKLLRHAAELTVQVDALLGLVATFDPDFRMVWTRANVAHPRLLSLSTTQDRCIKCFMPQGALTYLALLALGVGVVASISVGAVLHHHHRQQSSSLLLPPPPTTTTTDTTAALINTTSIRKPSLHHEHADEHASA